jgi:hypothetical protein
MQKLDALRFALAGGIYGAGLVALTTICTLLGIPGFKPFTDLLAQFYGFYGYSAFQSSEPQSELSGGLSKASFGFSPASTTFS